MLALLVGLFSGIVHILTGVLPTSPFQGITLPESVDMALGWLNWLVPVNDMMRVFGAWLAAGIIVAIVRFVLAHIDVFVGTMSGN